MYLKRLELKGFKSFADRTILDFNNGVACVVGPNGSGKSNITDAVRWVLGEQKVKTLRGAKMEDIIFSGTTHRSALGMAEVSLHFDNSSHFFPVDYSEVIVTRRIYKSGESEYLLNNTVCRLKDVRELFMDTGIGTDGYSIIGQGKIESILSGNGDDRRQVFEEAAGIVKYKAKKKEAVRKLENTELNLVRVEDIAGELKHRIEPLRQESEKAKEYLTLTEELKDIEINLFLAEIEKFDNKLSKTQLEFSEQSQIHDQCKSAYDLSHEQVKALEETLFDFENKQDHYNSEYRQLSDAFAKTDGDIKVIEERIRSLNNDLTRLEAEANGAKIMANSQQALLESQTAHNDELQSSVAAMSEKYELADQQYQNLSAELKNLSLAHEQARSQIIQLLNEAERTKSDQHHLMENQQRYLQMKSQVEKEASDTEILLSEKLESLNIFEAQLNEQTAVLAQVSAQLTDIQSNIEATQSQRHLLEQNRQLAQVAYEKTKTELRVLKAMEESMEGFDYGVKNLIGYMKKSGRADGFVGVVADLIEIPEAYETAIDIALGKGLQNVVADSEGSVKQMIDILKTQRFGRVTFLPLKSLSSQKTNVDPAIVKADGFLGLGSDLIKYSEEVRPAIEYLLGRTLIFKDYQSAAKALSIKSNRLRMVTLEGDLLIPGGAITGGSVKQKSSGVLNRKTKIDQLGQDLLKLETAVKEKSELIEKQVEAIRVLETQYKSKSLDKAEAEKAFNQMQLALQGLKQEKEQLGYLLDKQQKDLSSIEEDLHRLEEKSLVLAQKLQVQMKDVSSLESEVNKGSEVQESISAQYAVISDERTQLAVQLAAVKEKLESSLREQKRLKEQIETFLSEAEKKLRDRDAATADKQLALNEKNEALELKVSLLDEIETLKNAISQLGEEREGIREEVSKQQKAAEQLGLDVAAAGHRLHALEIELTKWQVERDNVVRNIEALYEMSLEEAALLKKELDEKTVNQRAKQIKSRLKELGDVNVGSIAEFEEVSERYQFLREQMDDLISGQNVLKKMIRELDTTMKQQFVETFEAIRTNFVDVFKLLFNGGTADLRIADDENLLESDIEIFAQPPGKKLQNLNLLSGGEKSLTAIALLFSTLKYKPAPFCMLDEIEAALDDVNVYRFAEFLKAFSSESQFVVITHRKGTMEIADRLYGVTMEEYGVSKIVSVKLEDVSL